MYYYNIYWFINYINVGILIIINLTMNMYEFELVNNHYS